MAAAHELPNKDNELQLARQRSRFTRTKPVLQLQPSSGDDQECTQRPPSHPQAAMSHRTICAAKLGLRFHFLEGGPRLRHMFCAPVKELGATSSVSTLPKSSTKCNKGVSSRKKKTREERRERTRCLLQSCLLLAGQATANLAGCALVGLLLFYQDMATSYLTGRR